MTKNKITTRKEHNISEGLVPALAISFLMLAAIAGLMKPDAVSFLRMSVRRLIGQLETAEAKVSGKPVRQANGAWDFWEGGEP